MPVADEILAALALTPAEVPALAPKARNALLTYLLRWGHYESARRCRQQLLAAHSHRVASRPATLDELSAIKGIGPHKLEQYGQAVLAILGVEQPPPAEDRSSQHPPSLASEE